MWDGAAAVQSSACASFHADMESQVFATDKSRVFNQQAHHTFPVSISKSLFIPYSSKIVWKGVQGIDLCLT